MGSGLVGDSELRICGGVDNSMVVGVTSCCCEFRFGAVTVVAWGRKLTSLSVLSSGVSVAGVVVTYEGSDVASVRVESVLSLLGIASYSFNDVTEV